MYIYFLLITTQKVVCIALKIPQRRNNENTDGVWIETVVSQ